MAFDGHAKIRDQIGWKVSRRAWLDLEHSQVLGLHEEVLRAWKGDKSYFQITNGGDTLTRLEQLEVGSLRVW